jgi:hypothetical protein
MKTYTEQQVKELIKNACFAGYRIGHATACNYQNAFSSKFDKTKSDIMLYKEEFEKSGFKLELDKDKVE